MTRVAIPNLVAQVNVSPAVDLVAEAIAADAVSGHLLNNPSGRTILYVIMDVTSTVNVTIKSVQDPYGRIGDLTYSFDTTLDQFRIFEIGRFTPIMFNQTGVEERQIEVDLAAVTGTVLLVAVSQ